jgi:metal-responsive CopG/Arc/MetJ family transcriptional regulator
MAKKQDARGRPRKPEKLTGNINFSCTPDMVAAVDAFAERHGMASRGHAMRRIVQTVIDTPQTRDK